MRHVSPQFVTRIFAIVGLCAAVMLFFRWPAHSEELVKEQAAYGGSCTAPIREFGRVMRFVTVGYLPPKSPLDKAAIKKAEGEFLKAYVDTHDYTLVIETRGPLSLCDEDGFPCIQGEWLVFMEALK